MGILILFFMNFLVLCSACLITFRLLRVVSLTDSIISCIIIYLSQITLSELFLGSIGKLNLVNVILLNSVFLFTAWIFARKKSFQPLPVKTEEAKQAITGNKVAFFLFSSIVCFFLVKITINLLNPPFGWDSLNYHFTFAVEWLKNGNLKVPITVSDDPSPTYYPINGSLYYLWLMLPLKSVFMADLGQVPFFLLSLLSVYSISRKMSLKPEFSFYAAGLFCIIPNFFKQLQIAYVDIMVAGLFLACLNALFLLSKSFTWQNILIFSLSLGLMAGTKTTALPFSLLLIIPFILLLFKNSKKFSHFIIFFIIVTALGSFSYLRNFIETGNPLYPLHLKVAGITIFQGVMAAANYKAHFAANDYSLGKILFHEGLGAQVILFVLPAAFLALPAALIKKRNEIDLMARYFLIMPILLFVIYRYLIPLANVRYIYCLLAIGITGGLYLYKTFNIKASVIRALVLICTFSSVAELAKRQELAMSLISTLIFFFTGWYLLKRSPLKRIKLKPLAIGCTFFLIMAVMFGFKWYEKNEYTRYSKMVKYSGFWPDATKAWDWLNNNTSSENIAYIGRPVPFPLYGSGFKNNVYYVSINSTEPAKLHYFPKSAYHWRKDFLSMHESFESEGNYRSSADFDAWLKNLRLKQTDFLFVYSLHQTKDIAFPIEDKWAKLNPDKFKLAFENNTIHIYKVVE